MAPVWTTDLSGAAWLVERIHGFAVDVGSLVPHGFEAYARIFHPIEDGPVRRWSDLAARNGRIAHPAMQFPSIAPPSPPGGESGPEPWAGSLRVDDLDTVARVAARHTGTPASCWFAVWDGYGQLTSSRWIPDRCYVVWPDGRTEVLDPEAVAALDPEVLDSLGIDTSAGPTVPDDVLAGPRLSLPGREYLLLRGAVEEAVDVYRLLDGQSPNLWWPDDRAWCVATEIDLESTYVGGSAALVADLVARTDLEVLPVHLTDPTTYAGDLLNGPTTW